MRISHGWLATIVGIGGVLLGGLPAQAEAPGLYYSWRDIDDDMTSCIDRSTAALQSQQLGNIQVEGTSISGNTENASAAFVCMMDANTTTVMIMVSSTNDDVALSLREALKVAF